MPLSAKLAVLVVLLGAIALGLFPQRQSFPPPPPSSLRVAASFYPLYAFASAIGGQDAVVINITPAGAEPHEYELTPQDVARIMGSDLVIVEGRFEPWAGRVQTLLKGSATVVLKVSDIISSSDDPHVWLDPTLAANLVDVIAEGFARVGPQRSGAYRSRAENIKKELAALDQSYQEGLDRCGKKAFVTSHAAFGRLAARYNVTQIPIAGLSPEEEPSAKALADIAAFARSNKIKYIFFERLISPKLAETLAKEIGAATLALNPLEGLTDQEIADGKNYFSVMRDNLNNLRLALECQ